MILAAGLSPAWQQILRFDQFTVGEVNRATDAHWCASGKVLNVGIALHHLQADVVTLSTAGGQSGRSIRDEFVENGIVAKWIDTTTHSRICTTILDGHSGETTELVENTPPISQSELRQFRSEFRNEAAQADVAVIAGSIPDGVPRTIWRDLLRESGGENSCNVILDFRGEELLHALETRPFLIKPNREELARTTGLDLTNDRDLLAAMRGLNSKGAEWVVVTDGPRAVWMTSVETACRFHPPSIHAVNPIGSGDCLTAGIAWGRQNRLSVIESVRLGVAAAVENAKKLLPGRLELPTVQSLAVEIECETL